MREINPRAKTISRTLIGFITKHPFVKALMILSSNNLDCRQFCISILRTVLMVMIQVPDEWAKKKEYESESNANGTGRKSLARLWGIFVSGVLYIIPYNLKFASDKSA
jgi:hypothetical protein